jgi:hypothetical protein
MPDRFPHSVARAFFSFQRAKGISDSLISEQRANIYFDLVLSLNFSHSHSLFSTYSIPLPFCLMPSDFYMVTSYLPPTLSMESFLVKANGSILGYY